MGKGHFRSTWGSRRPEGCCGGPQSQRPPKDQYLSSLPSAFGGCCLGVRSVSTSQFAISTLRPYQQVLLRNYTVGSGFYRNAGRAVPVCLESEVKVVSGTARLKWGSGEAWRFAMVTPSCHQASGEMAPPLFPTTWATLGSILSNSRLGLRFCAHSGTSLLPLPLLSQQLGDTKDWIVSHFRPSRQALVGNPRGCLPLCI